LPGIKYFFEPGDINRFHFSCVALFGCHSFIEQSENKSCCMACTDGMYFNFIPANIKSVNRESWNSTD